MKKATKIKIKLLGIVFMIMVTTGFQCKFITPSQRQLLEPITLNWWGTEDSMADLDVFIADYRVVHPNVTINYRRLREEEFERELLNALAEDRGPDIFAIKNTWVDRYISKIESLPKSTTMAYEVVQKSLGIKDEVLIEVRENQSITPTQLKNSFVDVVSKDVVRDEKIYGLPLSIDTLALFFNRDLLNNAGIPLPPVNWLNMQENVKRLTFQDQKGSLIQSGVAMGDSINIENSADLAVLLMLQNGARMIEGNNVIFGFVPPEFPDKSYNPGPEALRFYLDFSNPAKEVYTWDKNFSNSVEAFAAGKVAIIFGYQSDIKELEAKRQGKLNYDIAKVPQIEGRPEVNFARYQIQTVSKKSKNINAAWDFVQFISKKDEVKKYLEKVARPTALRSLINEQLENGDLEVFAEQLLTSTSWYQGQDAEAAEAAIDQMIDMASGDQDLQESINLAAQKIRQTL